MKIIDKKLFSTIENQMFNKARDIDVAVFNCLFSDMPRELVLDALSMYKNQDGGFGHGLEPDNYNPNSTAGQTVEALRIIEMIGYKNASENEFLDKVLNKTFNYLFNRCKIVDNKWCLTDPSNNNHACAIWYKHNDKAFDNLNNNPTAQIIAYGLLFFNESKPYYKKSLAMLDKCVADLLGYEECDKHEIACYHTLLRVLKEKNILADKQELIENKLLALGKKIVEHDPEKFTGNYPNLPLEVFSGENADEEVTKLIEANLDYLVDSLPIHGLWEANWTWCNDYPEQQTALLKWMGCITCRNLLILKKFNRLEV